MELKLLLPAGPNELFSHSAADNMIGVRFTDWPGEGYVSFAEVVENGRFIELTVEVPN